MDSKKSLAPIPTYSHLFLEAAFGIALLLGVRRLWVLVPASLLVAFFLSLTGRSWWQAAHGLRSEAASCGCFRNLALRRRSSYSSS